MVAVGYADGYFRAASANDGTRGAEVVVASERRQALAGVMGDRALRVNLRRPEAAAKAIVALAKRTPLDAVVAIDDQGVIVAALAWLRTPVSASGLVWFEGANSDQVRITGPGRVRIGRAAG